MTTFGKIRNGQLFAQSGRYFVKIPRVEAGMPANAVVLDTGTLYRFDDSSPVRAAVAQLSLA